MADKIAKKSFQFAVRIEDVQFNNIGSFFLKLTVRSTFSSDYSGLWVMDASISNRFTPGYFIKTDVVRQERKAEFLHFRRKSFTFFLPRGFCRNDASHDVYLLVEAFQIDDKTGSQRRVGESKYGIFPRTNKPKANLYAKPGENMYKHTDVWTLLRTPSSDNLEMHCGRMRCTTTFSEMLLPPDDDASLDDPDAHSARQPSPAPDTGGRTAEADQTTVKSPTPEPPPTSPTPEVIFKLPKSPTPPTTVPDRMTSPLDSIRQSSDQNDQNSYVSRINKEDIVIILHGASNLPPASDGTIPKPYCLVKMAHGEESVTQAVSEIPNEPTYCPSYEQLFVVEYEAINSGKEELVLQFVDKGSRYVLLSYNLPVSFLKPFHQYHLDLHMPQYHSNTGSHTYVTLIRRAAVLPNDQSSLSFLAFQVFLQGFEKRLKNPVGRLIAVARILTNYYSYEWVDIRERNPSGDKLMRNGGVALKTVTFPCPYPSVFEVSDSNKQSHPQITLAGGPPYQPEWNHSFLFTENRDKATLFTPSAALVIEYFQETKGENDICWEPEKPIGFSALVLDEGVYKQISEAKMGIRAQKLPVEVGLVWMVRLG